MDDELDIVVSGAVGVLTLNRPERRNALTASLMGELAAAVERFDADPTVHALVLTGAGPAFCAGFDLRNLDRELAGTRALSGRGVGGPGVLPAHDIPIVGAINGPAVTGGLELALSCDFLVASSAASFADTHARVGVMPAGGMSLRLPQLIGPDRARRMSLTGDFIDAATALAWGLVCEVTEPDRLLARAVELAATIAAIDPAPVAELRRIYDEVAALSGPAAVEHERARSREWMRAHFSREGLAGRADEIIARGRDQL